MDLKIYTVNISFEGHAEGSVIVTEPSERLEALAAAGYLRDGGTLRVPDEALLALPGEPGEFGQQLMDAADEALRPTASRTRTRKE